LVGEVGF